MKPWTPQFSCLKGPQIKYSHVPKKSEPNNLKFKALNEGKKKTEMRITMKRRNAKNKRSQELELKR